MVSNCPVIVKEEDLEPRSCLSTILLFGCGLVGLKFDIIHEESSLESSLLHASVEKGTRQTGLTFNPYQWMLAE